MDHVFLRGIHHQKVDGRSPPTATISETVSTSTGGTAVHECFLRNPHRLGGLGGSSLEDIPECFCPPLEVGKNSLAVALLVIGGARIGIFHAVTQRVVKEYCDLAGCGRNGFRLADTGRQAPEERS